MKFLYLSMAMAMPVLAYPQEQSDSIENQIIDEVIVSATRWDQKKSEVSSKVITINNSTVNLQNPQTAADLLNVSGKVFIQKSQQGGGSPMIRGFATNRLLYTVDGIRMNTAIYRAGNIQNVISLDPFAIETTEIILGPGSVIYGSDAIGGIMAFRTILPKYSKSNEPVISGKALARFSSANNEQTVHFDVNVGWKKWSVLSSFSMFDFDDLRMGSNGPEEYLRNVYVQRFNSSDNIIANEDPQLQRPTGYKQANLMQKISFRPSEHWEFEYAFHYSETSDYSRYDRLIRYRDGIPRYGEWNYGPQIWMMNNLTISNRKPSKIYDIAALRLAHQNFQESRISRGLNDATREIREEDVQAYSVNLDMTKHLSSGNRLFYGAEVVLDDISSTGTNEDILSGEKVPGPSRYPEAKWKSFAFYASDQYKLNDYVILQTGIRYNVFSIDAQFDTSFYPFPFTDANLNEDAFTGSMGLIYKPKPGWILTGNFATAFRSPNVDDMGKVFDSEPGSVTIPNPDLKAEYAYNADLGLVKDFNGVVRIDFSVFYTYLDNALVRRNFHMNGLDSIIYDGMLSQVQAVQNAAKAYVYGIQTGIEVKLPAGFGFSTDFNFQKGEEELDDGSKSPSRHAPPIFGLTRISYRYERINLQLYSVYSDEKTFKEMPEEEKGKPEIYAIDKDGNPYSPAWYTVNFKAMYQLTKSFSITAGIENITDQRYRPYSSGIAAPGRNILISVRSTF